MENFVLGLILGVIIALIGYDILSNSLPNIFNYTNSAPYRNSIESLWDEIHCRAFDSRTIYREAFPIYGNVRIPTTYLEEDEVSNEELIEPKVYKEKYLEW